MAKYNILREDEEQSTKDEKEKKQEHLQEDEQKKAEIDLEPVAETKPQATPVLTNKETPDDDFFSNDIFAGIDKKREEPEIEITQDQGESFLDDTKPEIKSVEEKPSISEPLESEKEATFEVSKESEEDYSADTKEPQAFIEDYEDQKQDQVNYKPILVGLSVVAVLVVIFVVVSNVFFTDDGETEPEQKPETAEERMLREQAERKQNILADLNNQLSRRLGTIQLLTSIDQKNVKYSTILLYGNSLQLEVFASDRAGLAKFNQAIKDNQRVGSLKLESVDNRPGSSGGIFALFDVDLKSIQSSASVRPETYSIVAPGTWIDNMTKQIPLSLKHQRQISARRENLFSINRNEYEFRGSLQNCLTFLNKLATANQNVSVHKLSLLPTDQRKMTSASYSLRLILDFYM